MIKEVLASDSEKKKEERETGGLGFWASLTWPFTPSKFSPYL
jgi:hypothetical protein